MLPLHCLPFSRSEKIVCNLSTCEFPAARRSDASPNKVPMAGFVCGLPLFLPALECHVVVHPSLQIIPEEGVEPPGEDGLPPLQRGAPRRRERLPHRPAPLQLLQSGSLESGEHGAFSLVSLFSLVLLLSLSLPIYWNWSKWLPCSLLHLFNLCHCHCQSTSRCQNKLPLNAPISFFTPFENGGKHWGNYKRRSGSSFSAAMPTTDGREEGWVTRARIPLRERARVRVLLLLRPGPQKRLGSSRTCLRDAFAASTPNARVRFCAAAGAVGREIASNFDASTKAR